MLLRGHRLLGIVMVLPLLAWAATGLVFFIKPGYGDAYARLPVKTYPVERDLMILPSGDWHRYQVTRTILGNHLLVETETGKFHYENARNAGEVWPLPGEDDLRRLVVDAIQIDPARYGEVTTVDEALVTTSTGVRIQVDWQNLKLYQRGRDTDRIDWLYRIHYLQWTGIASVDRVLGIAGLALLVLLASSGIWLFVRGTHRQGPEKRQPSGSRLG